MTLVYETFGLGLRTLKASKAGVHDALNLVGWITVECEDWLTTKLFPQSPAEGKTIRDDALKAMGLYKADMVHGTDAMRHIVRHHLSCCRNSSVTEKYVEVINELSK